MPLSDYPGFASLAPDLQAMLSRIEAGDESERPAALERIAETLNVFIGLDLLQFVFVTDSEIAEAENASPPPTIDLISPAPEPVEAIAWFTVDEAGYDEFRDAVTLFGDLADILNPPIVLDVDETEPDGL
jgi:transcriptional regulator with XRE-family HTH domain